ncbi:NfeD family protein [Novipirellula artificiosorum]|uniref:NfeD-like C-terminal domain-containing protein n=1 Tax=Novipirellula artificiosorum TaxID=2528016 RepID=A0A5C6DAZ0_9BACT|nr:NfeD family protein [Novipirellula artificiosorum]TWU32974.1 hypothetical protein Poly41_53530 [Novipirellula artificiosorum]
MPLYYAYGLLCLFYFLLVLEFFVPSGGLVGVAAVVSVVAAIAVAFAHSASAGLTLLLIVAATTPMVFIGVIRVWPHTPIGRRILNRRPGQVSATGTQRRLPDGTPLDQLVGRIGVAKTDLLPSGLVCLGSQRLDAVSMGMPIDAGSRVRVTKIEAGKIHVRPVSDEEERDGSGVVPQSPPSLENPPESFDFDSLTP